MIRKLSSLFKKKTLIQFTDQEGEAFSYPADPKQSVLDTLLNQGQALAYSCKAGVCKSCMMHCDNPTNLSEQSTKGLSPAERELGYFLPCCCFSDKTLSISALSNSSVTHPAEVLEKNLVSKDIIQLKLQAPFSFKGGQFCNLFKSEDICRSYSIASEDDAPHLEFHIKRLANGQFSGWAADELSPGQTIPIQGPLGECFYIDTEEVKSKPLLLSGIGTGLAPLIGVIRTALKKGHHGPITLVVGAKNSDNFYLVDEINELSSAHEQLDVHWVAMESGEIALNNLHIGDIYQYVKSQKPELENHYVYLCGAPSFIQKMKKQSYLSGAAMSAIFSDVFLPAN